MNQPAQQNDILGCTKIKPAFLDQKKSNTADREPRPPKTSKILPSYSSTPSLADAPASLRSLLPGHRHAARALPQALAATPPRHRPCGRSAPAVADQGRLAYLVYRSLFPRDAPVLRALPVCAVASSGVSAVASLVRPARSSFRLLVRPVGCCSAWGRTRAVCTL